MYNINYITDKPIDILWSFLFYKEKRVSVTKKEFIDILTLMECGMICFENVPWHSLSLPLTVLQIL